MALVALHRSHSPWGLVVEINQEFCLRKMSFCKMDALCRTTFVKQRRESKTKIIPYGRGCSDSQTEYGN